MHGRGHGRGFERIAACVESWVRGEGGLTDGLGVGRVRVGLEGIGETAVDFPQVEADDGLGESDWQWVGKGGRDHDERGSKDWVEDAGCGCTHAIPLRGYDTSPRPVRDYEDAGWKRSDGWGSGDLY